MTREQAELRAERLRVAIQVLDALPDFEAGLYPEARPFISAYDATIYQTCSAEDMALAHACLDVEREARRREWSDVSVGCEVKP